MACFLFLMRIVVGGMCVSSSAAARQTRGGQRASARAGSSIRHHRLTEDGESHRSTCQRLSNSPHASRPDHCLLTHLPTSMPNRDLTGLVLTRSERILVVALSYLYVAPLIFAHGKRFLVFLLGTSQEARRQLADEERVRRRVERRERAQRILREHRERREREGEAAQTGRQEE